MIHEFQCRACGARYSETCSDGAPYAHACGPLPADKKNPERERPDKRDENPDIDGGGTLRGINSEGAGVTCLTDKKLQEPRWISALKKRIAKQEAREK